ncbi:MAG: hypothetical protein HN919_18000, partial [Verrucomicrobia bacterium]|nr:hypothetical protein [Verrucomicrobiota bacterium]
MRRIRLNPFLRLAALALCACVSSVTAFASEHPLFMDVAVQNRFFSKSTGQAVIRVRLRERALLDLIIYDEEERVVGHRASPSLATEHEVHCPSFPSVASGELRFMLVAVNEAGTVMARYPDSITPEKLVEVVDMRVENETGQISFLLPRAAYVRLRAGIKNGPYLEPVEPWRPRPAGKHIVNWDGSSHNGLIGNLLQHPEGKISVLAVTLAPNALICLNPSEGPPVGPVVPELPKRLQQFKKPTWPGDRDGARQWVVDDYRIGVRVEVEGEVAMIRATCDPSDRTRLMNSRFEVMLFIDNVFYTEDERALLPFSYRFSTRG